MSDAAATGEGADQIAVRDNPERNRYEAYVGSELAGYADYHSHPGLVTVLHTEVDTAFEGQGVGSELVRRMLDDIRHRNMKVLPVCPFVRAFLQRHPEYADLAWSPDEAAP
jgi:predicted GNAT family acetyltransferase